MSALKINKEKTNLQLFILSVSKKIKKKRVDSTTPY